MLFRSLDLMGMETNADEYGSGFVIDRLVNPLGPARSITRSAAAKSRCLTSGIATPRGDIRLHSLKALPSMGACPYCMGMRPY